MTTGDEERELKEIRFQMQISPSQMKAVEEWGWANRIRTKAEAIRRLIDLGLRYDKVRTPKRPTP